MESIPLLQDLVILMAVSVVISIVLTRIGIPTIVGFFVAGVVIGPSGFGLVTSSHTIETLAQIGVVLLLFTIGLEFSITRMLKIRREAMLGGGLQLGITIAFVLFFSLYLGQPIEIALLLGFVVSLSSSAIVLKLLIDRDEVNSSHGKLSVGILLFQDICMVLMVLVIQGIGTQGELDFLVMAKEIGIALLAIAAIVVTVAFLVPRLFNLVVKLRNREVFILTIVLVCLGTAWLTSSIGLSLALGAFIAGLAISESEYSNQIVAEVLPFRDTFSSLFFVSIGMLLNIEFLFGHLLEVMLIVLGIVSLKALVVIGIGQVLKYPLRLSIIVGLNLAQIGEFSFILIMMGEEFNLISNELYQMLLAVALITMTLTPFVFQLSPNIAAFISRKLGLKMSLLGESRVSTENHVIIVGYGLSGKNLARVLKSTGINHIVIDINSERIKQAKRDGHKAYFGDSSHPEVLRRLGVKKAKMLVLAITDAVSTRRTVKNASELNPLLTIVVRTRYTEDLEELYSLGASQVVTEEFETSVEIFARVLKEYNTPGNIIQNQIDLVRQEGYAMLRGQSLSADRLARLASILDTSVMDTFFVNPECSVAGMKLSELDLRKITGGVSVMAIIREGKATTNPRGDFEVATGDMFVLIGSHAELHKAMEFLKEVCPTE
ncbi:MAG: cation:proton antiporter [Deltaproteobacteria bacterium]|nr:cation:proton antiporter [Deltaproteobacteria bacterium]